MNRVTAISLLVLAVAAGAADAQQKPAKDTPPAKPPSKPASAKAKEPPRERFMLTIFGLSSPTRPDFSETRQFEQFAETGTLEASYEHDPGFGGEVGLQYLFTRNVGAAVAVGFLKRIASADFTARFPHPLFLNRHREATGVVDPLSQKETVAHVDLVYANTGGKLGYGLFAGPTFFFNVDVDVMDVPQYRQAYPFDDVDVTSTPAVGFSSSAVGFNLGGDLGYEVARRFDVGLRVRYSKATVDLDVTDTQTVEVEAGGLHVELGIRLRF
jgi:opacity protein-like surface antigen